MGRSSVYAAAFASAAARSTTSATRCFSCWAVRTRSYIARLASSASLAAATAAALAPASTARSRNSCRVNDSYACSARGVVGSAGRSSPSCCDCGGRERPPGRGRCRPGEPTRFPPTIRTNWLASLARCEAQSRVPQCQNCRAPSMSNDAPAQAARARNPAPRRRSWVDRRSACRRPAADTPRIPGRILPTCPRVDVLVSTLCCGRVLQPLQSSVQGVLHAAGGHGGAVGATQDRTEGGLHRATDAGLALLGRRARDAHSLCGTFVESKRMWNEGQIPPDRSPGSPCARHDYGACRVPVS